MSTTETNTKCSFDITHNCLYYTNIQTGSTFRICEANKLDEFIEFISDDGNLSFGSYSENRTYLVNECASNKLIKRNKYVCVDSQIITQINTIEELEFQLEKFIQPQEFKLTFDVKSRCFMINGEHSLENAYSCSCSCDCACDCDCDDKINDVSNYRPFKRFGYDARYILHIGDFFIEENQLEDKIRAILKIGLVHKGYDYLIQE